MSGFSCNPARDVIAPCLNSIQRPTSSSRAMIWATKVCSFARALKSGCRRAARLRSCAAPNRMIGNLSLASAMGSSSADFLGMSEAGMADNPPELRTFQGAAAGARRLPGHYVLHLALPPGEEGPHIIGNERHDEILVFDDIAADMR